ncbi:MAG: ABC-F family ATP-binding cassette domain-containing protein [Deltaproteobacteria bacterium]|nr:ABC-F family ATP-binding cassette domain-containing protein [Deltaproteobacteria bacterium]
MIQITNLTKAFGRQDVFDDVSLALHRGERLGLVGRNGHGKTTLLRIIMGLEAVDEGQVQIPKNYSLGYLTQALQFTQATVVAEACLGLAPGKETEVWRVEKVLAGLGFRVADLERPPEEFSGGFQVRLNLAKTLVGTPDLLLLDEPTNYLDVVSIRWLAAHLRGWKGELILITHDRAFMDGVITHVAAIHRHKIRKVKGSTDKLYELIDCEEEVYEKTRLNEEKKRKEAEAYILRFRSKARLATNVQSRIKALAKIEKKEKLVTHKDLRFSFGFAATPAKTLLSTSGLSFSYTPDRRLIEDFNLAVGQRDRICVIGHNGQGKTTLLRLLAGDLTPDAGQVHLHNKTSIGYFAQTNIVDLNPTWSIEQEFMSMGCERQRARGIAGAMMFEGDLAEKKTQVLSGGERSRVLLGKILAKNSNLLLLDEPTNHLDMQSSDAFLNAVDSFEGSVIMVTHNEMFLNQLANRFLVFQQDHITYFEGAYQEFLDKVGWFDEQSLPNGAAPSKTQVTKDLPKSAKNLSQKELRRRRAALVTRASKELKPLKERMAYLEQEIMAAEERLDQLNQELIDTPPTADGRRFSELSREHGTLKQHIETCFEELEKVTLKHDRKAKTLAQQMDG